MLSMQIKVHTRATVSTNTECRCPFSPQCEAMRTSEFDSSEEEEVGEEQLTPFHISW